MLRRSSQSAREPSTVLPDLNKMFQQAGVRMESVEQEAISARLKQAREIAGISQEAIGDMLDPPVGQRAIANYEKVRVPWRYLGQWAAITGVDRDWLLHGEEHVTDVSQLAEQVAQLRQRVDDLLSEIRAERSRSGSETRR